MTELKLHLKCYSGMVQISVQAVTPKPHTETFLKLDLVYEKTCQSKHVENLENNVIIIFTYFSFLHDQLNPSMAKKSTDPFKIWSNFKLWHFFQGGTKLPAWPKISPIDGTGLKFLGKM